MAFFQTITRRFFQGGQARTALKFAAAGTCTGVAWLATQQPRERTTRASRPTFLSHQAFVRRAYADAVDVAASGGSERKIVFAFDTTDASQYAFEWALHNFFHAHDMVLLLNVRPKSEPPSEVEARLGSPITERQARMQEIERLDRIHYELSEARGKEYEQACRDKGIECKSVHAMGNPAVRIVDVGAENDADCIVLGTHDRGTLGRLTIGGVPTYVVHNAHCPVIVARPKKEGPVEHESPYVQQDVGIPPARNRKHNAENIWRLVKDKKGHSWGHRD